MVVDVSLRRFIDVHSDLEASPYPALRSLADGSLICYLPLLVDSRLRTLSLPPPRLVTLPASDGTILHGAVYQPDPDMYGPGPYPTLVCVYGGPGVQCVVQSWASTVAMRAQFFRAKGYLVFKLDNRGSACRGLAFEYATSRKLGAVEIDDQVTGVKWLTAEVCLQAVRCAWGPLITCCDTCRHADHFAEPTLTPLIVSS